MLVMQRIWKACCIFVCIHYNHSFEKPNVTTSQLLCCLKDFGSCKGEIKSEYRRWKPPREYMSVLFLTLSDKKKVCRCHGSPSRLALPEAGPHVGDCCSCEGHRFGSQQPHGAYSCLELQFWGILCPLLASEGLKHARGSQTHILTKNLKAHKIKQIKLWKKKM